MSLPRSIPSLLTTVTEPCFLLATFVPEGAHFVALSCVLCQATAPVFSEVSFEAFRFQPSLPPPRRRLIPELSIPVETRGPLVAVPISRKGALST